jgi:ornithine cyclodeaminase/alanine dehydrogenase-like protein (mu-crystallin family)
MKPLLYLSAAQVRQALPMTEAIEAMRGAFVQLSDRAVEMPTRMRVDVPERGGLVLLMPCIAAGMERLSLKVVTQFSDHRARGMPLIQALVLLADAADGQPLCILEGSTITALRTGAASGLATDVLARRDADVAAIFGSGVQARTQLEAVSEVRPIRQARVFDPDASSAEAFAAEMSARTGIPVARAETPADCLRDALVICTATTARAPVFDDRDLRPGAHINGVGTWKPDAAEVPAETVMRARIVVDHRESSLEEAGDLLMPLARGLIRPEQVRTEIGDVIAARAPGRQSADEITLFKSVGVAVQDLFAAGRALAGALRLGIGTELPR